MSRVNHGAVFFAHATEMPRLIQTVSMSLIETSSASRTVVTAFSPNAYMQNAFSCT